MVSLARISFIKKIPTLDLIRLAIVVDNCCNVIQLKKKKSVFLISQNNSIKYDTYMLR